MKNLPLGQETTYNFNYDNSLLEAIPRAMGRKAINIPESNNNFQGVDIWNCYEISWLLPNGAPCVRILRFYADSTSPNIVESKSLKLYFNSFTNHQFENEDQVKNIITKDLRAIIGSKVQVELIPLSSLNGNQINNFNAESIDNEAVDIQINDYSVNNNLLSLENDNIVTEELYSNLLKSNCLVTNQPDWACVYIKYKGKKIKRKSLLKYLISYRNHSEFHEQCVEHIFTDIIQKCQPEELTVYAKYTRRGGIDINPYRTNTEYSLNNIDQSRGIRQ
ncbi:MAG: hypothetical protein DGJ47_000054 [Rickettsiaceae bacterium]